MPQPSPARSRSTTARSPSAILRMSGSRFPCSATQGAPCPVLVERRMWADPFPTEWRNPMSKRGRPRKCEGRGLRTRRLEGFAGLILGPERRDTSRGDRHDRSAECRALSVRSLRRTRPYPTQPCQIGCGGPSGVRAQFKQEVEKWPGR